MYHFVVHRKLTQPCKSTILQYKIKNPKKKNKTKTKKQNRNRPTEVENKFIVTKGERGQRGIN